MAQPKRYIFVNVTQRAGGGIDTHGYPDRDTALIKAGLEMGAGGKLLHCAAPLEVPATPGGYMAPVFHRAPTGKK